MEVCNFMEQENKIKLGQIYGNIEEIFGKRRFFIEFDSSGILEYEKRMLTASDCPGMLPIFFLNIEGKDRVYYDFTGFIQLCQYINNRYDIEIDGKDRVNISEEALELISKFLQIVKGSEDYLLSSGSIPFLIETIFINPSTGEIAMTYIPSICNHVPLQNRVISLINCIDSLYDNIEVNLYLTRLLGAIYEKNLGLDGIISTLGLIQREVSYSQWTKQGFRRVGENVISDTVDSNDAIEVQAKNKNKFNKVIKKGNRWNRLVLIQAVVIMSLVGAFISNIFKFTDFVGFSIIILGLDLWLMRSIKSISA